MNAEQIMKIFADTAYIRTGGSPEELRTAQYLQDKVSEFGLKAEIVPFDVPMSTMREAVFQADGVEVACKGYLLSLIHIYMGHLDENQMAQVDDAIAVSFGLPGGGRAT